MLSNTFHLFSGFDIIRKHRIWQQRMPRVMPFYAVKCNDSPIIVQTLAALGTGFDCVSKGEIANVLSYGVAPQQIIYANPTKPISHLNFAAEMNVSVMTFDSDYELQKIAKNYPNARLVLRIRCDAKISQCPLGEKYGCNPDTEAFGLIDLAKSLELNMIGISFHVGSGCQDPPVYAKAIKMARKLFDYAETVGYHFKLLDIGGGFPGDKGTDIKEIASIVNRSIDLHFPSDDVTVIAEPGRFYVSSAYTLACQVHSKCGVRQNGQFQSMMYYINDGVYGPFNSILYDHQIAYPLTLKSENEEKFRSIIFGPTCDALDCVCENVQLPQLNIDDFIIFENMGAYTIPIASPFNGFPLPKVEYYVNIWKILMRLLQAMNTFSCAATNERNTKSKTLILRQTKTVANRRNLMNKSVVGARLGKSIQCRYVQFEPKIRAKIQHFTYQYDDNSRSLQFIPFLSRFNVLFIFYMLFKGIKIRMMQ